MRHAIKGTELTIRLDGELDSHVAAQIREELDALIDQHPKVTHLLMDVSGLTFMDSSGIGMVIGRYKRMASRGGTVSVQGADKRVDRIFAMSGLYQIIQKA